MTDPGWDTVAAEYASTREGEERLTALAQQAAAGGDVETEARLLSAVSRGQTLRSANVEAAEVIHRADLGSWSPVEVDTELARLYTEETEARARMAGAWEATVHAVHEARGRRWWDTKGFSGGQVRSDLDAILVEHANEPTYATQKVARAHERYQESQRAVAAAQAAQEPFEAEFRRRGGWNRAFLVSNGNGHVHKSRSCSTCFPSTQYYWVTEMSDKTEPEIVAAAGARACTVCYPSAPATVLNRPTRLFTPDEVTAQQARQDRAAAKEQRDADRIAKALTADGSEFVVPLVWVSHSGERVSRERFKTERSAVIWATDQIAYPNPSRHPSYEAGVQQVIDAVAAKHGKDPAAVRAELETKAAAKRRRDGR